MKKKIFIINLIFIIFSTFFTFSTSYAENSYKEPNIHSEACILIEENSGNILYEKNSTKKMYPASTTKIMTAILALENCSLNDEATVSENAVKSVPSGYTTAKLVVGEKISIENLLYGLMLNSANEAANVIAEHVSGSIDEFAKLMNKKAKELGCTNTNFVNANGMHNENHYTTAEDLAKIAEYGMKNNEFRKIVSTKEYTLPATNMYPKEDRIMKNTNLLIDPSSKYYFQYAVGIKTGFTTEAGNCLVSYSSKDKINLICVTLKASSSPDNSSYRFIDSKNLLEYGYEAFSNKDIIKKEIVVDTKEIDNATKETKYLKIITENTVSDYISNNIDLSNIKPEINLQNDLKAPIIKGQKLGTITYKINNKEYSTNLIAETSVDKNTNYIYFTIIIGIILLVISLIINFKVRKNKN